jgi:sigma-B regulation protein RsbU (phosphoserine phosphatase)
MATMSDSQFRSQLEQRKKRLVAAIPASPQPAQLSRLLEEVDSTLDRMTKGSFGVCEICHEEIERERILLDPFARVCLSHLSHEQRAALEEDLQLAARIQRALLPPQTLRADGWNIHFQYDPAGTVSGDYCDVIRSDKDGGLFFALGDVSGKGVAASMLMAQLHAMFRSLASVELSLDGMVERANRLFCEGTIAGQFATLVCGRANRTGEVELSSAGHPPALVIRKGEVVHLEATGLPLGMFCEGKYDVRRMLLEPGDSVVLYSDGISETANDTGTEYGIERLSKLIGRHHALSPGAMVAACLQDVKQHAAAAPQADDRTIMVLQRAPA